MEGTGMDAATGVPFVKQSDWRCPIRVMIYAKSPS